MNAPAASTARHPTPRELEIKLRGTPEVIARVLRSDFVQQAAMDRPRSRQLHSTYFDTPEAHLRQSLIALRLRKDGRRWIQTLKRERGVLSGLHERDEIEHIVRDCQPDYALYDFTEFEELFADADLKHLIRPCFTTSFRRTTRTLQMGDSRIEMAYDRGEVLAGSRSAPLCELELELKIGEAGTLFDLARRLCEEFPLRLDNVSKAERGFALALAAPPAPGRYHPVQVSSTRSPSDAFAATASACLSHLQSNEIGVLEGDEDPEYVHQMRVALRRLRATIAVFRPVANSASLEALDGELQHLAQVLGAKRDWDVFCMEALPSLPADLDIGGGMATLMALAQSHRQEAGVSSRAAVADPRFTLLLLAFGRTLHVRDWQPSAEGSEASLSPSRSIEAFARASLEKARRRAVKRSRLAKASDAPSYHPLRIALKKLRYGGESFAGIFPRRTTRPYLDALAELQSHLGRINDAATALRLADTLRKDCHEAAVHEMLGALRGYATAGMAAAVRPAEKAWRQLKRATPFWA